MRARGLRRPRRGGGRAAAPAGEAQPAGGESGAQDEAAQAETAQADGGQAEAAQSDGATAVSLSYSAHVSNIGWMGAVAGGEVAGTTGRGLPLEALRLVLSDASTGEPLGADAISVEAHVSNVGWQAAVGNGGTAGTTGQSRAVEALRVRLSGELSARYTVWYRVHSAEFGWLGWACDGADAGSAGYGRAVQAVQVAVLPKGDPAPGDTATPVRRQVLRAPLGLLPRPRRRHRLAGLRLGRRRRRHHRAGPRPRGPLGLRVLVRARILLPRGEGPRLERRLAGLDLGRPPAPPGAP